MASESAAHHDDTRAKVPSTAIGVAALRARESRKALGERLFEDPYAEILVGEAALEVPWTESTGLPRSFWETLVAARTRWIDDALSAAGHRQVVFLGAGLDTRAYRLQSLTDAAVYEVDFKEVLEYKEATLKDRARPVAALKLVAANLAVDDWVGALRDNGFTPEEPSTWVLEGLTGYLTDEELTVFMRHVGAAAAVGSRLIVTFVGKGSSATSMHRFFVESEGAVDSFLLDAGWRAESTLRIGDVAQTYGRGSDIPTGHAYFLSVATRCEDSTARAASDQRSSM